MILLSTIPIRLMRARVSIDEGLALLRCDYSGFAKVKIDERAAGEIRRAQLLPIRKNAATTVLLNLCNGSILVASQWSSPMRMTAVEWLFMLAVCLAAVAGVPAPRSSLPRGAPSGHSVRRAVFLAFLLGSVWGIAPALFYAGSTRDAHVIMVCLCAGMASGGAFKLASLPLAALTMMAPLAAGSIAGVIRDGGDAAAAVALIVVYFLFTASQILVNARDLLVRQVARLQIEKLARIDDLTGLPNTAAFRDELRQAGARLKGAGEMFSVVVIDIDNLGDVNRRLGHAVGDLLIQRAAARLRDCARRVDFVARLDADAFAVLTPALDGAATLSSYASRLRAGFDQPFDLPGGPTSVSASFGVAAAHRNAGAGADPLRDAMLAVHLAKSRGGDRVHIFSPADEATLDAGDALEADLRAAMQAGQLELHYQPFLDVTSNDVVGFEALLRWRHPIRGNVPPPEIVALAEQRGLINSLGAYVLSAACRAAAEWPGHLRVAVNVSPLQLRSRGLGAAVAGALKEAGLPASRLEIEITENAVIADHGLAKDILQSLRDTGVHVALDDFGVGFSSLNYLWSLPIERLKLDKSFVDELPHNEKATAIVGGVLHLARDIGLAVTVEGVETAEQLWFVRGHLRVEAQGYLIGRPMPESAVADFLRSRAVSNAA